MSSNSNRNNSEPRTRGRGIIRGGSGKVLYDSTKDDQSSQGKSSSTIRGGDGKILYEDKKE